MTAPVDVLAVLDLAAGLLIGCPDDDVAEDCSADVAKARAAIADLTERAQALSDAITFRIDDPRCELHCKLIAALAAVGVKRG